MHLSSSVSTVVICDINLEYTKLIMLARQSQRYTRDCPCVLAVTFLEEAQRLLSRFVCVYFGYISQGAAGARACSGRLMVASLEETWGLLSRFDCVYSGYITQGCAGPGALVGCYEPTCQMLLFPYTRRL